MDLTHKLKSMKNKKKLRFSEKVLIGIFVFILIITTTYTIIFYIKGAYPVEIFVALVPTVLGEFIILGKLELDKRNREETKQN